MMHSHSRLGSPLTASDSLHSSTLPFLHSMMHLGSSFPAFGIGCMDLPTPVSNLIRFGPATPMRSSSRLGSTISVPDHLMPGSSMSLQVFGHPGLPSLVFSLSHTDLTSPALDFGVLDLAMSPRSPGHLETPLSVLDYLHPNFLSSLQVFTCISPSFAASGITCLVFTSLVLDFVELGPLPSSRFSSRSSAVLPVMNHVYVGALLPSRSLVYLNAALPVLDYVHPGPLLPLRSLTWLGSLTSALDPLHSGLSPLLHSFGCLSSTILVLDHLHPDSISPMRSSGRLESTLSVMDPLHLGLLLFSQSAT